MRERVSRYIENKKDSLVSLLASFIEIPTINPPGENYERMALCIERYCRGLGLPVKRCITPKGELLKNNISAASKRVSLLAEWNSGHKKYLHVASHYDVVPAEGRGWKTDPFRAVIKNGRIYGRGAEDMKGNIASALFAVEALKALGIKPRINIQLSFTPDEETGGATGMGYILKKGEVKADYALSEGYSGRYISIGNKGVLWAEVDVHGRPCHASMPWIGVNAFERMLALSIRFKKLKERIERRKTSFNMPEPALRHPSFVMGGLLKGGSKVNVVPAHASFTIDRRLIPEEDIGRVKREICAVVADFNNKYRDSKAKIRFTTLDAPRISKRDGHFFDSVSGAVRSVIGSVPEFCLMPGATDLRFLMQKGVPALGYSVRGGNTWHGDNEFVYIKGLMDTAKIYALIMASLREDL